MTNASGSWQDTTILPAGSNIKYATDYQQVGGTQYMLVTNTSSDTWFYYNSGSGWQQGNQAITGDSDLDFAVNSSGVGMVITLDDGADFIRDINYATGDIGATTNSAPTVTGLPAGIAITEDIQGNLDISSSSFADSDSSSITVTLSVSTGTIGVSASGGNDTSTVTIVGTPAAVNQYLDIASNVHYNPPLNLNGTNAATLTVSADDGSGIVVLGTVPINIAAVNDAPKTLIGGGFTVMEDVASPLTGISFADVDAGAHSVTATFLVPSGALAATSSGSVMVNNTPQALMLTGSIDDINAFIAASKLTFTPAQDATAPVPLTIQINDNGNTGSGGPQTVFTSTHIIVNAVNDAPTVTTSVGASAFTEPDGPNNAPVIVDSGLTVGDVDNTTLASATVSITNNFETAEDELAFVNNGVTMGNISAGYDTGTGVLTLTSAGATADLAEWEAALRAVTYNNVDDSPSTAARTISFVVNDGFDESTVATKTITVTAVNDTPTDISLTSAAVAENAPGADIGVLTTADPDQGDTHTYSVGDSRFEVLADGTLKLRDSVSLDYESEQSVTLKITSTDSGGLFVDRTFTVNVADVNDAPVIISDGGGTTAAISVAENTRAVTTVTADDPDIGDALTYSVTGGADAHLFAIDPVTGRLSFKTAPDFETPADVGGDNIYDVTVRATDNGSSFDEQALSVTVTDVGETLPNAGPRFTGPSELSVGENQAAVAALAAYDPDGDALTYKITGGADAALFQIDARTGELSFIEAPDFEAPGSAAGSNDYQVRVEVSDGSFQASRLFHVSVTDTDDETAGTDNERVGTDGDDVFHASDEAEHFLGGDGRDTVIFTGPHDDYAVTVLPDGTVTVAYGDAVDTLDSIERLQFEDGTLAFDTEGTAGQMFRLYQAVFGREPDAEGLGYWVRHQDAGQSSFEDVARSFMASPEFEQRYGSEDELSNADFLDLLYQNVLGRDPDADGFAYWTDKLDTGQTNFGDLLAFFSDSKENIAGTADAVSDGIWFA